MSDRVIIGKNRFDVLVAITVEETETGLMYRPWPPPIMAFPFTKAGIKKFWMKNTVSPLDVVFCLAGKIIAIENGNPFSLDYIGPDEPCDLVVEFPCGTMKNNNILPGDNIKLSYSVSTLSKKFKNYLLFY